MFKKTSVAAGLAIAAAGGVLLTSAPADAQVLTWGGSHRHHMRVHNRNTNVNRNHNRIVVRIRIKNRNNNVAVADGGRRHFRRDGFGCCGHDRGFFGHRFFDDDDDGHFRGRDRDFDDDGATAIVRGGDVFTHAD